MKTLLIFSMIFFAQLAFADSDGTNGELIYKDHCAKCHKGGIGAFFSRAPLLKKPLDWQIYLEKGEITMAENVIKGTKKMKPKGGCKTCSQEDIENAVRYVIDELKIIELELSKS